MPVAQTKIVWVCADGSEFDSEAAAEHYEAKVALVADMECADIYWRDVSPDDVAEWLLSKYTITRKNKQTGV